jgi:pathogenesis-related protein 1
MRVSLSLACGALAFLCGCPGGSALDEEQVDAFVAAHNVVRAEATPAPSPALPPLAFDADLARTAQEWSARCVFEHSTNGLGENLAIFSGADSSPDDVVDAWASEAAFYTLDDNSCADGEQCGHYTQIVWRQTQRVGCGVSTCNFPELGGDGLFWVCNYDPPGNFIGERPY